MGARCADGHLHVVLLLKRSSYFQKRLRYTGLSVSPIMASTRQRMAHDVWAVGRVARVQNVRFVMEHRRGCRGSSSFCADRGVL